MWDGPERGYRVLRGGSWNNNNNNYRAAYRNNNNPNNTNNNNGFRVARKSAGARAGVSRSATRRGRTARLSACSRAPDASGDKYTRGGSRGGTRTPGSSGAASGSERRRCQIAETLNRGDAERAEARNPEFRVSFCFPRFRDSGRRQQTA